jgi:acetyl-CoA/propionyl-CoA carboxylase, biotin carboxylase, biotin carboxyl carrier protein
VPTLKKVLVANRGEIAVRVIRGARDAGLASVAVFADPDRGSPFVRMADEAVALAGESARDTYLDGQKIIAAAKSSGADSIHPGYGFLAENADFAQGVIDAGLIWIGPSPDSIRALGDKVIARQIAKRAGAPLAPGTTEPAVDASEVVCFAQEYGLPIAIKAVFGGGGRGMRVAWQQGEVTELYESAVREATAAFGRGECYVERYLGMPRHVETQVLADQRGNVVVLGTRDCSLQRRSQKVVEEAPAPFLTDTQREVLYEASKAICREVAYHGVGTVEFLIGRDGLISFLEVNTRLQVEHPVTEETTGIDLVAEQFRIAEGKPLSLSADPAPWGHAIEFRINAEDPGRGFLPTSGSVVAEIRAAGPGVRVDSGVESGSVIGEQFDSLLAKLIVWGADRDHALRRARRALAEYQVIGLPTLLPFHKLIACDPAFTAPDGDFRVHTQWIESEWENTVEPYVPRGQDTLTGQSAGDVVVVHLGGQQLEIRSLGTGGSGYPDAATDASRRPQSAPTGATSAAGRRPPPRRPPRVTSGAAVVVPMQGTVIKLVATEGGTVVVGDLILVLEAMKMENPVVAHRAGRISGLTTVPGQTLASGTIVCEIRNPDEVG